MSKESKVEGISSYPVGVLTEVTVMLALCSLANKMKGWFN